MENGYIIKCEICGCIVEDEENVCMDCELKESKNIKNSKSVRDVKRQDSNKNTHRTKKRQTKPRKEVEK